MQEPKFALVFFQHKTSAVVTMKSHKENIQRKWQYLVLDKFWSGCENKIDVQYWLDMLSQTEMCSDYLVTKLDYRTSGQAFWNYERSRLSIVKCYSWTPNTLNIIFS
jgi:hypothetical protein